MNEAVIRPLIAKAREALGEPAFAASGRGGRALSYEKLWPRRVHGLRAVLVRLLAERLLSADHVSERPLSATLPYVRSSPISDRRV